jgi:F-type H+-transporting ATPase subunit delta
MTAQAVARRYAGALFDVMRASGSLDQARADLNSVAALIAGHPDLRFVLATPAVPAAKKRAIVDALVAASPGVGPEVGRLLLMLAERDRLVVLGAVAVAFDARVMQARGVIDATIVTAAALPPERQASLGTALAKAAGTALGRDVRDVRVAATVDPSIIGGVIARVGTVVFDGSVIRQLENMKRQLLADA